YTFESEDKLSVGISQVPFGIQPYASHSFWFQMPYYLGLEDDYDAGFKYTFNRFDNLDLDLAYYHSSEPEGPANGSISWGNGSGRYSYDIVNDNGYSIREQSQGNVRAAYHLNDMVELGASAQVGGIYNTETEESEFSYAAAAHGDISFLEQGNLQLEYINYDYAAKDADGNDIAAVPMGAYGIPYNVASKGQIAVGGVSWAFPVDNASPVNEVKPYVDYSILIKDEDEFNGDVYDSQLLVPGVLVTAGPIYTYIDVPFGKNHPWLTDSFGSGLAQGTDADWNYNVNINLGYYF
ncbi:MAG: hypothetical protein ACQEQV_00820, partial [Fibrobacterota bacterium]